MAVGGLSTDSICRALSKAHGRRVIIMTGMGLGALFGLLGVNLAQQREVAICLAVSMASVGMCEGVFWTTATEISRTTRGFSAAFMNTGGNVGVLISQSSRQQRVFAMVDVIEFGSFPTCCLDSCRFLDIGASQCKLDSRFEQS